VKGTTTRTPDGPARVAKTGTFAPLGKENNVMKKTKSNQVSIVVPSQQDLSGAIETIGKLVKVVGGGQKPLTPLQRSRTTQTRAGASATVRTLGALAVKHGVDTLVDVPTMLANSEAADRIRPLAAPIANLLRLVGDLVLSADGAAWKSATAIYTILQRLAVDDGTMAQDLAPIAASFAHGPQAESTGSGVTEAKATDAPTTAATHTP
jgi:hypothetical protein